VTTGAIIYGAEAARRAAAAVRRHDLQPDWGIVLGSGFGAFGEAVSDRSSIPFAAIPGMPATTVAGHRGLLHQGLLGQTPVAVLEGRLHGYEGHSAATATFPIRLLAALGARHLLITNAAGGLSPQLQAGSLMLIRDHLNIPALAGNNPLAGEPDGALPRFVAMRDAYSADWRAKARAAAERLGLLLHEGVYAMVAGPSYETPAEVRFLRHAGADAVGMSTASEVIVARQLGLQVLAVSCITNAAHGEDEGKVQHADVLAAVRQQVPEVLALFREILAQA
jgi:purine-nucleoside phosphorylase